MKLIAGSRSRSLDSTALRVDGGGCQAPHSHDPAAPDPELAKRGWQNMTTSTERHRKPGRRFYAVQGGVRTRGPIDVFTL